MKIHYVIVLIVVVVLAVVCFNYTTSHSETGNTQPSYQSGPYQIVFGKVIKSSATLEDANNGYNGSSYESEKLVCFKINTVTGEVWILQNS